MSGKGQIKLQSGGESGDSQTFTIEREIAEMSGTIKNILEDCPILDAPIPLPTSAKILEKVLEYCKYHHANPDASVVEEKPEDQYRTDNISDWDKKFCEVPHATLFELIIAANFLDIKPLLDVTCKTVANMIKGKSPQDIRDTFGIKNDFTPEEEEQVRKENLWCEEH
mmetsp:Transcript_2659/g.3550  ORF Transcript_2659/g.3550 Transcript_2659/m.3550 type:complete len:168 (-) Transcript_2659:34-537(-)|eukprot:CAMPEP_0201488124 /NCGR_PEP_ID=MMETSP0151_2-20130828/17101_1 /ASSEMBLY_ACC=CAM_ASM_000257 /TAXON_ID=200890 /ORGANISM="Paramoeba atlantica, Strain 621/1 / CCAP 1560/9" /LENGTH=167 /DNA_ID=CAMNT_0047873355 /DNA_START=54 /DNA_END=557 /DNA_ORIENTATION=+